MRRFVVIWFCGFVLVFALVLCGCSISPQQCLEAAAKGDNATLRRIEKGDRAVLLARDTDGLTPLHLAAQNGNGSAVRILLSKGADANCPTRSKKWTPLHFAAKGGYVEICKALIDHGANPNALDLEKWTPLHLAAGGSYAESGYVEICKVLLDHGANPNAFDLENRTPLWLAAGEANYAVVNLLLNCGADINARCKCYSYSALRRAIDTDHYDMAGYLLWRGAKRSEVEEEEMEGITATPRPRDEAPDYDLNSNDVTPFEEQVAAAVNAGMENLPDDGDDTQLARRVAKRFHISEDTVRSIYAKVTCAEAGIPQRR